jgi:voltage-gated potassium channel
VITWLVFLIDLVVHLRLTRGYLRTGLGSFDLIVVLLTSPWYLLPGASAGALVNVLRLARLARLLIATRGVRRLLARLGRVAIVAVLVVVVGSAVAYGAEHPTNPGFATFGDALWWGIVTLTTVGYGDIVPKTSAGRWAGVAIMITGISVLGLLAGSLASFFRLGDQPGEPARDAMPETPASAPPDVADLTAEIALLRTAVARLTERLDRSET